MEPLNFEDGPTERKLGGSRKVILENLAGTVQQLITFDHEGLARYVAASHASGVEVERETSRAAVLSGFSGRIPRLSVR